MLRSKHYIVVLVVLASVLFLSYCNPGADGAKGVWLIPENEVRDGGPGKDGIAALTNPDYVSVPGVDFLLPTDLVIGFRLGGQVVAFPHPIMDHHEIVNDIIEDMRIILSYCPLTGSAMAWEGDDNANNYTYGVSGLLYNSNLILYDRETDSNWSQMLMNCVNGERTGENSKMRHVIETTWSAWREMYPNSLVLSTNTGYGRNYSEYPYGDYKANNSLLFSVNNEDSRLHKKERVHGVIISSSNTKVYVIGAFTGPGDVMVITDSIGGTNVVVVGSAAKNFAVSYVKGSNAPASFSAVQGQLPVVMTDNEGNLWDIFGFAVSGPRAGERLTPTTSYNAYWFAWAAFYPNAGIYQ